jgi:AcrR family transcriptional regulator
MYDRPAMQVKTCKVPGVRRAGRATAQRIIEAARALLLNQGYAGFSMRNVAAGAGLHLANVQYYFPNREALIRAILADTGARYRASYQRLLAEAPRDRTERFREIVTFNLRDIAQRETRRFFIQLWALLGSLDDHSDSLLNELYEIDIQQLSECIAELQPAVPAAEVRRRATLLAAMIEGLIVVRSAHSGQQAELSRLMAKAHALGMQIALGEVGCIN